jgi:hypothetical protein
MANASVALSIVSRFGGKGKTAPEKTQGQIRLRSTRLVRQRLAELELPNAVLAEWHMPSRFYFGSSALLKRFTRTM